MFEISPLGQAAWREANLPCRKFDRLHHVGTFDREQKATTHNRCSLEGNGLSVSKHPEEWRKIARLGDCPTWSIQARKSPIVLIDAHAMTEQQWGCVTAWAHACGLIEPTRVIRVSWMDDEMGDVCQFEFDLKQPGKTEKDIENEARLEYEERIYCEGAIETVDAWQSTPAMNERLGWSVESSLALDMALTFFAQDVAFEGDGIAGVWWNDQAERQAPGFSPGSERSGRDGLLLLNVLAQDVDRGTAARGSKVARRPKHAAAAQPRMEVSKLLAHQSTRDTFEAVHQR